MPPETRMRFAGCDLLVLGTIPGFVPDAVRVESAFASHKPDAVALGIPPEDLANLQTLAVGEVELDLLDETDARLHYLLGRFGATRIPSPDLEMAYRLASAAAVPLHALDLDDETHSGLFTKSVGVRHLVQASSRRKKAMKGTYEDAPDAYDVAVRWDAALTGQGPQSGIERQREAHMAARLRELAKGHKRLLAIVPVPRLAGVVALLTAKA